MPIRTLPMVLKRKFCFKGDGTGFKKDACSMRILFYWMKRRTSTSPKELPKQSQNKTSNENQNGKQTEEKKKMVSEDMLFKVSMKFLVVYCCGLPLFGFIACVLLAFIFHFEGSTRTHCNVPNYLPSISSAIGDYTPERYIWRICICLHILPRMAAAMAYANYYLSSPLRPMVKPI